MFVQGLCQGLRRGTRLWGAWSRSPKGTEFGEGLLDNVLGTSTHPLCPCLSKGDMGMEAVCPTGVPSLPHVPHKAEQECWYCFSPCAGKVSSSLCSEQAVAAIPPSPVPAAPFLPSCGALIDAMAPSTRSTNKHLYPLLSVPTPPAHRAAGKRASFWCQTAPAQLMPADFGAVWCQRLLQLIFLLPGSPPHKGTSWGGSIDLRSAQQSIWSSD